MMKHLLLLLPPMLGLACATARAQTTGDFLFSKVGVDGSIEVYITPNSTDLLGWNGSGAMTQIPRSTWLTPATAAATYEPILSAGTTGQFYRGDKTWQTLNAAAVGLGNVSNALQLVAANNLSDLVSVSTARTNLGLGAAALLGTSSTGSAGAVAVYGLFGSLSAVGSITASASIGSNTGAITSNGFTFSDGTYSLTVGRATLTANRQIDWPNVSGDLITTGDTGTVTNTMLAGSIALSKLSITGTPDGTKYLRDDGSWQTLSTGLTINATTTSGASAGDILTSDGTLLQKLTPGTGVSTWLASPTLANLNSAVSDADMATTAANTFTAAQTIASGTLTASAPGLNVTQTWNSAAVQFKAARISITQTAYSSGIGTESYLQEWLGGVAGATQKAYIDYNGGFSASGYGLDTSPSSGGGWLGMKSPGECTAFYANGSAVGAFGWFDGATNYRLVMRSDAKIGFAPSLALAYVGPDAFITREAAAILQAGMDTNGDAVDQTLKAADGITGTDRSGGDYHFKSGLGTGAGAVSALIFSTPTVLASGTTAQSYTERLRINSSGITIGSTGSAIASIKRSSVTLVAGTATVSDTATTANTVVLMSVITPGGTVGTLDYDVSAGSSYTINSSSATDTSTINITVIHFP